MSVTCSPGSLLALLQVNPDEDVTRETERNGGESSWVVKVWSKGLLDVPQALLGTLRSHELVACTSGSSCNEVIRAWIR